MCRAAGSSRRASLGHAIGDSADYIAIGVLVAFGLYTLLGSEQREQRTIARLADSRVPGLLLLGLSISLDELAIGFTLGLLRLPVALSGRVPDRRISSFDSHPPARRPYCVCL